MTKLAITTASPEETSKLAQKIATHLHGDETFAMVADLGGGKTAFTQGLAKGMGVSRRVISPTFVLERIYKGRRALELHHFDVYRISEPDIHSVGLPEVLGQNVVVVEWADKIKDDLPADAIWIEIQTLGETKRKFIFTYPESRAYIFKDAK